MKEVVSVSLGSEEGNHQSEVSFAGELLRVKRIGTNGSLRKARQLISQFDGQAAAIGIGGINFAYRIGARLWPLPQANRLKAVAKITPVVDGSAVKDILESSAMFWLQQQGLVDFNYRKVLVVSVLDRFAMAQSMQELGAKLIIADAMVALKLPIPFRSLDSFSIAANLTMPILRHIPIQWLYPLGKKQGVNQPTFGRFFQEAEIIAGDGHFIFRYMPQDLRGKTIITGTVTGEAIKEMKKRGAKRLITTFPGTTDRTYGANVWEAIITAVGHNCYYDNPMHFWDIGWTPQVIHLN